jgi:hypothetical protein
MTANFCRPYMEYECTVSSHVGGGDCDFFVYTPGGYCLWLGRSLSSTTWQCMCKAACDDALAKLKEAKHDKPRGA